MHEAAHADWQPDEEWVVELERARNALADLEIEDPRPFERSQFPFPVCNAVYGMEFDPDDVFEQFLTLEPHKAGFLETFAAAAELVESAQPDRDDFFMDDAFVRGMVFSGAKWKAGWGMVWGHTEGTAQMTAELDKRDFLLFTAGRGHEAALFLGRRPTSLIYFLQLMVRYGLIWGRQEPGAPHELGHFLEKDMPGVIVALEEFSPLDATMVLCLMKFGAPAVVGATFPFPLGRQRQAETVDEAVEMVYFDNLRVRPSPTVELRSLPDFMDPANRNEEFEAEVTISPENAFLLVEQAESGSQARVTGDDPERVGFVVHVDHPDLISGIANHVEKAACRMLNCIACVRAERGDDRGLSLAFRSSEDIDLSRLAQAVKAGLALQYPRIGDVGVELLAGGDAFDEALERAGTVHKAREEEIASRHDEIVDRFCYCMDCQPFSLEHVCIITPDRPPMCNRDPWDIMAGALFGVTRAPYKRRDVLDVPSAALFDKGECLDRERGEYAGLNEVMQKLTHGRTQRVFLHSVEGHPHTSCGCFRYVIFRLEGGGLGIMARESKDVSPDGRTWSDLANQAGGKQSPGVVGVGDAYLRSPKFMQGDGGWEGIEWTSSEVERPDSDG